MEAGAKCLIRDGQVRAETIGDAGVVEAILRESAVHLQEEKSKLVSMNMPAGGGKLEVFFEVLPAPPKLVVVGAGHIAVPLVKMAKVLDFHVIVTDDRLAYANRERFPDADEVLVGDMAQMLKEMSITPSTYIVLITRGHKYDEPCLREIIHSQAKYIGMIGSRRRIKACFQRFRDEEKIAEEVIDRVYAPIGLDIATETPAEIALSILGEIIKVRRGGKAASLSGHQNDRCLNSRLGSCPRLAARDRDVEAARRLNGVIFSDLGQASSFMALDWVQEALQKSLGFSPFPATLNLRPRAQEDAQVWEAVQNESGGVPLPPVNGGFCSARLYRVHIHRPADSSDASEWCGIAT